MKAGKNLLTLAILAMAAGVGQAQNNRTRNVSRATRHTVQKKERVLKDTDDKAKAREAAQTANIDRTVKSGATTEYEVYKSSTQPTNQKTVDEIQREKKAAATKDSLRKSQAKFKRPIPKQRKTR